MPGFAQFLTPGIVDEFQIKHEMWKRNNTRTGHWHWWSCDIVTLMTPNSEVERRKYETGPVSRIIPTIHILLSTVACPRSGDTLLGFIRKYVNHCPAQPSSWHTHTGGGVLCVYVDRVEYVECLPWHLLGHPNTMILTPPPCQLWSPTQPDKQILFLQSLSDM